jgi:hypothetical protein
MPTWTLLPYGEPKNASALDPHLIRFAIVLPIEGLAHLYAGLWNVKTPGGDTGPREANVYRRVTALFYALVAERDDLTCRTNKPSIVAALDLTKRCHAAIAVITASVFHRAIPICISAFEAVHVSLLGISDAHFSQDIKQHQQSHNCHDNPSQPLRHWITRQVKYPPSTADNQNGNYDDKE